MWCPPTTDVARLSKTEALAQLERERQRLFPEDAGAGCIMCALSSCKGSPEPLVETEQAVVVLNRFASRTGHLMVIVKRHVERGSDLEWIDYQHVQRQVYQSSRALEAALGPARLFTATLGASVPLAMSYSHYHVHVIPVFESDERARPARVLSWSSGVTVYTESEARALRERLLAAWPRGE